MEIKVNIEASDLSQAITHLALAIESIGTIGSTGFSAPIIKTTPAVVPALTEQGSLVPGADAETAAPVTINDLKSKPVTATVTAPLPAPNESTAKPIDLETISRAGAALVDQGKMDAVLKILQEKYGIFAVTQLTPEQYGPFAEDLKALGAEI